MALSCDSGTFTKNTGGGSADAQNVTVAFDPKALIIWGTHRAISDADTSNHDSFSYGFCDDADNNRCVMSQNENAIASARSLLWLSWFLLLLFLWFRFQPASFHL